MDEPEDDLTFVYMWAYKQAEKKYKGRIQELEEELQLYKDGNHYEAHERERARTALEYKKDD